MIFYTMFSTILIIIGIIGLLYAACYIYSSEKPTKRTWSQFFSGVAGAVTIILVGIGMAYFKFDTNLPMLIKEIFG